MSEPDQAVSLDAVREAIQHLEASFRRARDATTDLREDIKAVAERAGIEPSALRAFVAARCSEDKYLSKAIAAEQLDLLFEEVGEGGGAEQVLFKFEGTGVEAA